MERASNVNDQQFEMMMQMHRDTHDKIDSVVEAVREVKGAFGEHIDEDKAVHKVVDRHTAYWRLLTGSTTSLLAYLGITK